MSSSVETQKHMFLIRPSHCLHVVTMSPSARPNRPTQVPSDCRAGCLWRVAKFSKSYGRDPSTLGLLTVPLFSAITWLSLRCIWLSIQFKPPCFTAISVTSVIFSCTSLEAPVLRSLLAETDYFQLSRTQLSDINLEERFDCWIKHVSSVYNYSMRTSEHCHIS